MFYFVVFRHCLSVCPSSWPRYCETLNLLQFCLIWWPACIPSTVTVWQLGHRGIWWFGWNRSTRNPDIVQCSGSKFRMMIFQSAIGFPDCQLLNAFTWRIGKPARIENTLYHSESDAYTPGLYLDRRLLGYNRYRKQRPKTRNMFRF